MTSTWSPDGQRLAFVMRIPTADGGFDYHVGVVNGDGTDRRQLTLEPNDYVEVPRWSPDGQWILYARYPRTGTAGCAFMKIPASGGTPTTVVPATKGGVCGGASWR